jgi:hypothetical protein
VVAALAVVGLVVLLAPGLGEVRHRLGDACPPAARGGLALGAWILHQGGMSAERIGRRSVPSS